MTTATAKAKQHGADATEQIPVTHHRTTKVDGINIFYREAGPRDAPVVLLLHGFPTSSHMFRNLIPALADRYRVIAPDYPGFGQSDMPDRTSSLIRSTTLRSWSTACSTSSASSSFAMYVMDYGAPVGWRLALKHPERVTGLIVQNGNAYEEGLTDFWDPIKAYWADGSDAHRKALKDLVTLASTKFQYTDGVADVSRISPDNWVHDQALLDRPGNADIQLDLFYDYRTNLALYPKVQAYPARAPPADDRRVGQERQDLPRRGSASLQARLARGRVPPARHWTLRTRGQARRDGAVDPRLSRAQPRGEVRRGAALIFRQGQKECLTWTKSGPLRAMWPSRRP